MHEHEKAGIAVKSRARIKIRMQCYDSRMSKKFWRQPFISNFFEHGFLSTQVRNGCEERSSAMIY